MLQWGRGFRLGGARTTARRRKSSTQRFNGAEAFASVRHGWDARPYPDFPRASMGPRLSPRWGRAMFFKVDCTTFASMGPRLSPRWGPVATPPIPAAFMLQWVRGFRLGGAAYAMPLNDARQPRFNGAEAFASVGREAAGVLMTAINAASMGPRLSPRWGALTSRQASLVKSSFNGAEAFASVGREGRCHGRRIDRHASMGPRLSPRWGEARSGE